MSNSPFIRTNGAGGFVLLLLLFVGLSFAWAAYGGWLVWPWLAAALALGWMTWRINRAFFASLFGRASD